LELSNTKTRESVVEELLDLLPKDFSTRLVIWKMLSRLRNVNRINMLDVIRKTEKHALIAQREASLEMVRTSANV
jgi:hypothetical protein